MVPKEYWGQIVARLDQVEQHRETLDAETEAFNDDWDGYDPAQCGETNQRTELYDSSRCADQFGGIGLMDPM